MRVLVIACVLVAGLTVGLAGLPRHAPLAGTTRRPTFRHPPSGPGSIATRCSPALLRTNVGPAEATGAVVSAVTVFVTGALVAIGLLFLMIQTHTGLARFDRAFAEFGATHPTPTSTTFLRTVSQLGGYVGVIAISLVVALVESRRSRARPIVGFLALVVAGQFLVANLVKLMVDRPRPDLNHLTGFSGSSFPSGHATAAAATFMACAFLISRRRPIRAKAALVGVATGLARRRRRHPRPPRCPLVHRRARRPRRSAGRGSPSARWPSGARCSGSARRCLRRRPSPRRLPRTASERTPARPFGGAAVCRLLRRAAFAVAHFD